MQPQALKTLSDVSGQVVIPPVPHSSPWADGSVGVENSASRFDRPPQGAPTQLVRKAEPRSSTGTKRWLPWLLALTCAAGAGFLFYQGQTKANAHAATVGDLEDQLRDANKRAAAAESEARSASGELVRATESLDAATDKLEDMEAKAAVKAKAASELEAKLNSLLEEGQGEVLVGKDGRLTLQLVDKVLFRSGEADLTQRGEKVMARVGAALKEMKDKQIWVQGHTDNVPVKKDNEFFASNWELSSARALTVVHYLQDVSAVNPRRLAATAFSSYRPVSKRNKAKNRRIEIVLMPRDIRLKR